MVHSREAMGQIECCATGFIVLDAACAACFQSPPGLHLVCAAIITDMSYLADCLLCLLFHRDDATVSLDNTICLRRSVQSHFALSPSLRYNWRWFLGPSVRYSRSSDCGCRTTAKTSTIHRSTRPSGCCVPTWDIGCVSGAWFRLQSLSSRGSRMKVKVSGRLVYIPSLWFTEGPAVLVFTVGTGCVINLMHRTVIKHLESTGTVTSYVTAI